MHPVPFAHVPYQAVFDRRIRLGRAEENGREKSEGIIAARAGRGREFFRKLIGNVQRGAHVVKEFQERMRESGQVHATGEKIMIQAQIRRSDLMKCARGKVFGIGRVSGDRCNDLLLLALPRGLQQFLSLIATRRIIHSEIGAQEPLHVRRISGPKRGYDYGAKISFHIEMARHPQYPHGRAARRAGDFTDVTGGAVNTDCRKTAQVRYPVPAETHRPAELRVAYQAKMAEVLARK